MTNPDKIVKTIELDAPIGHVWAALTDHKQFGEWFRVALDQPFEAGGKSTGQMTYPGHEHVKWIAFIDEVVPQHLFSFRWYDCEAPRGDGTDEAPPLRVEFRLEERSGGTRLTITESGFATLNDARRIELMRSNTEGWNIQAGNIADYLDR